MNTSKNLQIDVLAEGSPFTEHKINLYIDGICFRLYATAPTVDRLVSESIVTQVKGERHNDKGELVEFDYPNGIDSAGVQFTSIVFEMKPKHTNP